jgi:hypothetical protein
MIDLDDVLDCEELGATTLQCVRVTETVNGKGRAVTTEATTDFGGIVTQDSGAILDRFPEYTYVKGSILVTTAFPLRMDGESVEADIILWNGKRYAVNQIADYLIHGVNWAVCNPDGVDNG